MRLLLLSSEFPPGPGGIGIHAWQLALHLTALGWEVTTASPQDYVSPADARRFNEEQPFAVHRLHPFRFPLLDMPYRWAKVAGLMAKHQPDLIVATGRRAVWLAASLPRKCPLVAIGHGSEFGLQGWQLRLTQWAFQRCTQVICVSNYTQRFMLQRGIRPKATCVIPNGADDSVFHPLPADAVHDVRKQMDLVGAHLILTVGQVTARKGQRTVIEALPQVLERYPNTHYLIAGLPTLKESLVALAESLGVQEHVHFLGIVPMDTLVNLLSICDLFAMTSITTASGDFEGYGIAVVEAALCGKPSVVSDNSGLPEAIVDGETGLVVPQNNPQRTAEAIIKLLEDGDRRTLMGESARQHALQHQTWAKRVREYDAVFRGLISA